MDPETADDILEDSEDEDSQDSEEVDEYGAAILQEPHILHADGDVYDLRDSDQVDNLQEKVKSDRNDLQNGELSEYEGHSTNWGSGGRSRLLYDQCRGDLAQEYHEGKHNMSFVDQHKEALKVVRIVAIKNRARY